MRKNKLKILLSLFLMSLTLFSVVGCAKKEDTPDINESKTVVHNKDDNDELDSEEVIETVVSETLPDELYKPFYLDEMEEYRSNYNYESGAVTNSSIYNISASLDLNSNLNDVRTSTVQKSSVSNFDGFSSLNNKDNDSLVMNWNTEEYNHEEENRFMSTKTTPFSTFGADVDTASYANLRRMVFDGQEVPKDAVRIEEMINYFNYSYEEPMYGEPFSVTAEITSCPWNEDTDLLMLGLQTKTIAEEEIPDSNIVFLLDVSGSMAVYDKLPLVKQAFSLLTNELGPNDTISIVTYASDNKIVLEGVKGDEKEKILTALDNLFAGGGTAGADGINTAYDLAEKYFIKGGNNRVILATDGDLNLGPSSESELVELVQKKLDKNIFLSVMGFGTGNLKDNKMEALANNGNGNYNYIDSVIEAKKVLVDEMESTLYTVAKDVKLQVEFNPAMIKGYRLIGYENRQMNAEDFADDTKDGGEVGAGHRVTVLYEIVKSDSEFEIPEVESKYNNDVDVENASSEYLTLNIRYKEPEGDKSVLLTYPVGEEEYSENMSDNMNWASGVAQIGMLLRNSEYAGTSSYEDVKSRLKLVPGVIDDEFKSEFIYLISRIQAQDIVAE